MSLAIVQQSVKEMKGLLDQPAIKSRFNEIMAKRAPSFMASIVNLISQSEQLAKCDPKTVIASCIVAATFDFPVEKSLGFAYIVPYGNAAQFQLGYKGLIQLALRSGQYAKMNDFAVNKEAFLGYDEVGDPRIDFEALDDNQPAIGFAIAWKTVNGFAKLVYWSKEKCLAHGRKYSRSLGGKNSPWQTDTDAMCRKTVIRAGLSKYGILSIEMRDSIAREDDIPMTTDDHGNLVPTTPEQRGEGAPEATLSERLEEARNVTATETTVTDGKETKVETVVPAGNAAALEKFQARMLDLGVPESKIFNYAKKIQGLVPEGVTKLADMPAEALAKLEPALEAMGAK